jgi:hypothetical protein
LPFFCTLGIDQRRRIKAFFDCKRGVIYATCRSLKPNRLNSMAVETPKAVKALAKAGDKEVMQALKAAHAKGETLILSRQQASIYIDRAIRKGLLDEDD